PTPGANAWSGRCCVDRFRHRVPPFAKSVTACLKRHTDIHHEALARERRSHLPTRVKAHARPPAARATISARAPTTRAGGTQPLGADVRPPLRCADAIDGRDGGG